MRRQLQSKRALEVIVPPSEREFDGLCFLSISDLSSYIAAMLGELTRMASGAEMTMLAYFLGMAQIEAEMLAHGRTSASPGGGC